jgi:Flp pilus assembly protein TadD
MKDCLGYGLFLFGALLLSGCAQQTAANAPPSAQVGPGTLNVADAAIAGGDPSMALSVSQSILTSDPNNVDALIHEGDAYYALDRCPASEAAYQLALKYNPKSTTAETGLARCLLKTDPAAAEQALLLAIQDDPGNAAAYNDLGIARDLQGNFAGAIGPYRQALTDEPSLTAAEVNLGLSLALSGRGADALQYLGPLASGQDATPKIREDYAVALVASGRDADARQVLSVDLTPDQVNAAVDGFAAAIAGGQPPLPQQDAAAAPPPTTPEIQTAPVSASPLAGSATATTTQVASAAPMQPPAPMQSTMAYTPDNSDSAYSGPSPVPGAVSSSEGSPPEIPAHTPVIAPPAPRAAPVAAPAAAIAPPASAAAVASGPVMVQLAALNSQSDAERAWSKISAATPALFGQHQPDIQTAVVNGHTYYRLRTGGFSSVGDAAKFCGEVSAAGNTCTVARF